MALWNPNPLPSIVVNGRLLWMNYCYKQREKTTISILNTKGWGWKEADGCLARELQSELWGHLTSGYKYKKPARNIKKKIMKALKELGQPWPSATQGCSGWSLLLLLFLLEVCQRCCSLPLISSPLPLLFQPALHTFSALPVFLSNPGRKRSRDTATQASTCKGGGDVLGTALGTAGWDLGPALRWWKSLYWCLWLWSREQGCQT